ncbi:MAG TPA: glycosyltransferase family 87 protein [Acidobacteriaceae bacterium]
MLGPPPGLTELNVACWTLFISFLLVPLGVVQWAHSRHEAHPIRQLNSDFVYVYGVGWIARTYSPALIYDLELQQQVFHSIEPPRDGIYGPSPYPPFVALFFAPLTYLSFESAYLVWLGISLGLYVTGIGAAAIAVFPRDRSSRSLTYCFALAFYPFLFGTLLNGQLASIAAGAVGVAMYQENRGRWFWSGLALSLLCYKPTLLVLLVPMLLLTRRFKTALGFVAGAGILVVGTTLVAGTHIWALYADMLRHFGSVTGAGGSSRLQLWKYLDLTSCFAAISGNKSANAMSILGAVMIVIEIALAALLWRSADAGRAAQWLAWAATFTSTLLLNVYVPIYDSVLVVIAIILTIGALREMAWERARSWVALTAVLILVFSWKTETIAHEHGIQLLTVLLLALGALQWILLGRVIGMNRRAAKGCNL